MKMSTITRSLLATTKISSAAILAVTLASLLASDLSLLSQVEGAENQLRAGPSMEQTRVMWEPKRSAKPMPKRRSLVSQAARGNVIDEMPSEPLVDDQIRQAVRTAVLFVTAVVKSAVESNPVVVLNPAADLSPVVVSKWGVALNMAIPDVASKLALVAMANQFAEWNRWVTTTPAVVWNRWVATIATAVAVADAIHAVACKRIHCSCRCCESIGTASTFSLASKDSRVRSVLPIPMAVMVAAELDRAALDFTKASTKAVR